jgi:hypothetical protein
LWEFDGFIDEVVVEEGRIESFEEGFEQEGSSESG